ncbi:MAG: hypothetical protein KIT27_07585, partial [Legionellales bacterium]|nr:hypothetical protein [Legionellales bacterium]
MLYIAPGTSTLDREHLSASLKPIRLIPVTSSNNIETDEKLYHANNISNTSASNTTVYSSVSSDHNITAQRDNTLNTLINNATISSSATGSNTPPETIVPKFK